MTDTPKNHLVVTASQVAEGDDPDSPAHAFVRIPGALLAAEVPALGVWEWAEYVVLGRRTGVARAGRAYLAGRVGCGLEVLDASRRAMVAAGWVWRSENLGHRRTVRHRALGASPRTRYAGVPSWTLTRVRVKPAGDVSRVRPDTWRMYARMLYKAGEGRVLENQTMKTIGVDYLGGASIRTAERRMHEAEAAGLVQVIETVGERLTVHLIVDRSVADATAARYASAGRLTSTDPPATPARFRDSPLPDSGTRPCQIPGLPLEVPVTEVPVTDEPLVPAVGDLPVPTGAPAAADAAETTDAHSDSDSGGDVAAVTGLYRLIPERLRVHVPEHGSRRVLRAIAGELTHRTAGELAERITRQGQVWAYVIEDVKDATAVATTIVRRGYECPDIRCEDHHRLDTGQPCTHCETITAPQKPAQAPDGRSPQPHPQRPSQTPQTPYRAPRRRPLDDTAYRERAAEARARLLQTLAG